MVTSKVGGIKEVLVTNKELDKATGSLGIGAKGVRVVLEDQEVQGVHLVISRGVGVH